MTVSTVSLILCETAARVLDLAPPLFLIPVEHYRLSEDAETGYELAPGAQTSDGIAISQQGLRDREYLVSKPEGTFRIAMIGDSIPFGFELAERDVMAKVLERLLNEAAPNAGYRYEVMNFGVTGYNSHQIARQLATRVLPFRPDLIVYVYCLNDPQQYSFEFEQVLAKAHANDTWGVRELRALVLRSQMYRLSKIAIWRLETGMKVDQRSGSWDDPQWRAVDTHTTTAYFTSLHEPSPEWDRPQSDINEMAALARQMDSKSTARLVPLADAVDFPSVHWTDPVIRTMMRWL